MNFESKSKNMKRLSTSENTIKYSNFVSDFRKLQKECETFRINLGSCIISLENTKTIFDNMKFMEHSSTSENKTKASNLISNFRNLQEELETFKRKLESCIISLENIKTIFDNIKFSEKTKKLKESLHKLEIMSSSINSQQNQLTETELSEETELNQKAYYENLKSIKDFTKNLKGFYQALQNSGTRFNAILNKGHKLFDDEENKQLFKLKTTPSNLKAPYFNALNAWLEIKYMSNTDADFDTNLNNFKTKIKSLYENLAKIDTKTSKK